MNPLTYTTTFRLESQKTHVASMFKDTTCSIRALANNLSSILREPSVLLGSWQNRKGNCILRDTVIAQLSPSKTIMVNAVVTKSRLSYLDICVSFSHC